MNSTKRTTKRTNYLIKYSYKSVVRVFIDFHFVQFYHNHRLTHNSKFLSHCWLGKCSVIGGSYRPIAPCACKVEKSVFETLRDPHTRKNFARALIFFLKYFKKNKNIVWTGKQSPHYIGFIGIAF